jgi:hypothetical protein
MQYLVQMKIVPQGRPRVWRKAKSLPELFNEAKEGL